MIREIVAFEGKVAWDPTKPDGMPRKLLDVSRLSNLGFRPEIGFAQGIRSVYEWYRSAAANP